MDTWPADNDFHICYHGAGQLRIICGDDSNGKASQWIAH